VCLLVYEFPILHTAQKKSDAEVQKQVILERFLQACPFQHLINPIIYVMQTSQDAELSIEKVEGSTSTRSTALVRRIGLRSERDERLWVISTGA
jgi:hypothetical protein